MNREEVKNLVKDAMLTVVKEQLEEVNHRITVLEQMERSSTKPTENSKKNGKLRKRGWKKPDRSNRRKWTASWGKYRM